MYIPPFQAEENCLKMLKKHKKKIVQSLVKNMLWG